MKTLFAVVMIVSALPGCGSKTSASESLRPACDAFALNVQSARELREQATAQYASAESAMEMWERWNKKEISAEDDGTGKFSGAGTRAREYKHAGDALCESSVLVHSTLRELPVTDKELRAETLNIQDHLCMVAGGPIDPEPARRKAFKNDWLARKQKAHDEENAVLDVCRQKISGWSPSRTLRLHAPLLKNE